jgi:hypothetical protein
LVLQESLGTDGLRESESQVLGAGVDYAYTTTNPSLAIRVWAQGSAVYQLSIRLDGDPSQAQTAAPELGGAGGPDLMPDNEACSTEFAAAQGTPLVNLDEALHPSLVGWSPAGDGWDGPPGVERVRWANTAPSCSVFMNRRWWRRSSDGAEVVVNMIPCATLAAAVTAQVAWLDGIPGDPVPDAGVFDSGADRVMMLRQEEVTGVIRGWIQGTDLYTLAVSADNAAGIDLIAENARLAQGFETSLPGLPSSTATFMQGAYRAIVTDPMAYYIVIWLCLRMVFHVGRQRGSMTPARDRPTVPFEDLQRRVTIARRNRFWRWLGHWIGVPWLVALVLGLAVGLVTKSALDIPAQAWILCVGGLVFLLLRRRLRPSGVESRRHEPGSWSGRGVAGRFVWVAAQILFALSVVSYLAGSFFAVVLYGTRPLTAAEAGPGFVRRLVANAIAFAASAGPTGLFFCLAAGTAALFLLERLGLRLRARSLREAQAAKEARGVAPFLFLRSFKDDGLKIRAKLRFGSLIGSASLVHRIRFEEVVAAQLSRTAPVVAASEPGRPLAPLGAARGALKNLDLKKEYLGEPEPPGDVALERLRRQFAERHVDPRYAVDLGTAKWNLWKLKVADMAAAARAVVISATPASIDDGLRSEVGITAALPHQHVILVRAPWKKGFDQRWAGFVSRLMEPDLAGSIFTPLTWLHIPPGIQVLAHKPDAGWRGFGSEQRIDWSYAMCLERAVQWLEEPPPVEAKEGVGQPFPSLSTSRENWASKVRGV